MRFKYSQYPTSDGKSIYRPSIPIILKYDRKFIYVEALGNNGFLDQFEVKLNGKRKEIDIKKL